MTFFVLSANVLTTGKINKLNLSDNRVKVEENGYLTWWDDIEVQHTCTPGVWFHTLEEAIAASSSLRIEEIEKNRRQILKLTSLVWDIDVLFP